MRQATPASPLKVFGSQFAFYRSLSGLTAEQVGQLVYLSGSTIRKVEAGLRAPTEDLVTRCEEIPQIPSNGALRHLFESLRENLKNRIYPVWFENWPEKEGAARRLRSFEALYIPGLLQTEKYARTVLSSRPNATEDEIEDQVAARIERQAILHREKPTHLWAILDEGALRRQVGSREDMREQLRYVIDMARKPHIVIQMISLEAGPHEGLRGGAFVLADFEDTQTAAYQDTALAGQIIDDGEDVDALVSVWEALQLVALPRTASLRLIEELAEIWN